MCNFCNTGFNFGRSGCCGCSSCSCGCGSSLWSWGNQRICRDCNGNIWVNQRNSNGCGCGCDCNSCNNSCNCNGNGTDTAENGNGNSGRSFTSITFCGSSNGTATTVAENGEAYYLRQYGLTGRRRNSCGCNADD